MTQAGTADLSQMIEEQIPYLRRYARALTGSQESGDAYAIATLEAIVGDPSVFDRTKDPRVSLYRAFHAIWSSSGAPVAQPEGALEAKAQSHLSKLTRNTREALLLHTIEGLGFGDIATVMRTTPEEAEELVAIARREMRDSVVGRILVIEDEAIIAMDLQGIVSSMGHSVTGIARTKAGALRLADNERPDLILADIQLADNSSGIDAVTEILARSGEIPVIFITAFPERLLTGKRPEPAFLITKPYTEEQVFSAVSQAMFFSSTESLLA